MGRKESEEFKKMDKKRKLKKLNKWLKNNVHLAGWITAVPIIITFLLWLTGLIKYLPPLPTSPPTRLYISADLQPEFSPSNDMVNYTVKICNNKGSSSPLNEIRIYTNQNYSNFSCDSKTGWNLLFLKELCIHHGVHYYIFPGECEIFEFGAHTPESGCKMEWKFEARDTDLHWIWDYDFTYLDTC